jgi:hypothetical protein
VNHLLTLLFLCCLLPAQVVRVANIAPVPFSGWVRTTVDVEPPHAAGEVAGVVYVVGRAVGLETRVVDVRVTLAAGEERSIDLAASTSIEWTLAPLPADPMAHFGGACTFAGEPLALVGLQPDGAAWLATMRGRVGRMFVVTVWVPWFPDQPAWAYGECAVIASNPAVPDMVATAPPGAALQFGSAYTFLPGRGVATFLAAGDTFADGQGRVAPVMFFWPQHMRHASDFSSVGAAADWGVSAVGVSRVWADGNPAYPASFNVRSWVAANLPESARRLWTWDVPVIGPAIRSSASGGQEEQFWTRGEPMLHPAATNVVLFSALKLHGERPCNHHEIGGEPLDLDRHLSPRLLFWDGRPHTSASVNPAGLLGKPRALNEDSGEARGRYGPDNQHFMARGLTAGARYTGSPAAQYLLGQLARAFLLARTSEPGWATSGIFSAREIGYAGEFVVDCHLNLEDRVLAARVVQRWREIVERIYIPQLSARPNDVWVPEAPNDARVGDGVGQWWQPWMQAHAALGMDDACRIVGPAAGRALALRGARAVLRDGFTLRDGQWVSHDHVALDGRKGTNSSLYLFGTPGAVAVVLRHDPENAQSRAILQQMQSAAPPAGGKWMPPGVQ